MISPANVKRSMMAAQSRGSVKVPVQAEKAWLDAIAIELVSSRSENVEQQFGAAAVELHVAELVDAEQVHPPVAGDGLPAAARRRPRPAR